MKKYYCLFYYTVGKRWYISKQPGPIYKLEVLDHCYGVFKTFAEAKKAGIENYDRQLKDLKEKRKHFIKHAT